MSLFKKIVALVLSLIAIGFVILLIGRWFYLQKKEKTDAQVEKIHSTKLQLKDVTGENLPPDPKEMADASVPGVDANMNGIRDDVELAIFEKYPDSAKTRAALLQYALALQMQFTQPFVNEGTATEVLREDSRAKSCLADTLVPRNPPGAGRSSAEVRKINEYIKFVDQLQINTEARSEAQAAFYKYLRSYSDLPNECDIDMSALAD